MMAAKKHCEGTLCPLGCCPEVDWYCCQYAEPYYFAATADDCFAVAAKAKLLTMASNNHCDGTMCPAVFCPEVDWYYCDDNG